MGTAIVAMIYGAYVTAWCVSEEARGIVCEWAEKKWDERAEKSRRVIASWMSQ